MLSKRGLKVINYQNMQDVSKLDASENKLKNIDLSKFANLKQVNLAANLFENLEVNSAHIVYLNMSENPLKCINILFSNLRELDVSFTELNKITQWPQSLLILNISHTRFTSLEDLPASLEKLYANYNSITSLSANLPKLQILHVNYCQLENLNGMPDVAHFTCRGNRLTSMIGLSKAVECLNISENNLEKWDGFHENVRVLSCYKCDLKKMPDMLNVEVLYCHHNLLNDAELIAQFGDKIVDRECLPRPSRKYKFFIR